MTEIILHLDEDHILSADSHSVFLRARKGHDVPPCVLIVPREVYHKVIDAWLNEKADYGKRFGHFCGVGFVAFENVTKSPLKYWWLNDHGSHDHVEADVFCATEFQVEMEHG